jgi:hypothetical protein
MCGFFAQYTIRVTVKILYQDSAAVGKSRISQKCNHDCCTGLPDMPMLQLVLFIQEPESDILVHTSTTGHAFIKPHSRPQYLIPLRCISMNISAKIYFEVKPMYS